MDEEKEKVLNEIARRMSTQIQCDSKYIDLLYDANDSVLYQTFSVKAQVGDWIQILRICLQTMVDMKIRNVEGMDVCRTMIINLATRLIEDGFPIEVMNALGFREKEEK